MSPTGPRRASLSGLTIELMLLDLTAGDLENPHGDEPLLPVEQQPARAAVDLDGYAHNSTVALTRKGSTISTTTRRF